jgi:hypothetical protein
MEDNLKDLEIEQKDVVKMLTELDMENSIGIMDLQSQQLKERLQLIEETLKNINQIGQDMDGNTSNEEETEFIFALK